MLRFVFSGFLFLVLSGNLANAQGIPLTINYQGKVEVNGLPFDGTGQFRFALVSQAGVYLWTNDGKQPNAPTDPVSREVRGGLYSVNLGDTSITPSGCMTEIPVSVFSAPGVSLRVWFNDGAAGGWQQLLPDKQLTSVPYAYKAEKVGPKSITGENLARESVWPEHEGRSNTIVTFYATVLSGLTTSLDFDPTTEGIADPVPTGRTFVITDVVFCTAHDDRTDKDAGCQIQYVKDTKTTVLTRLKQATAGASTYREPVIVPLRGGLSVPEGALLQVYMFLEATTVTVTGFLFDNN